MRIQLTILIATVLLAVFAPEAHSFYRGKRILWVESYNDGYAWTDGITRGVNTVLKGTNVELRVVHLDTKRHADAAFAEASAREAKALMDTFRPDVILASDDNAQRYFILPYVKGTGIPVVFCGVNWDASEYGYPTSRITGMIERTFLKEGHALLAKFAQGSRVTYLAANSESEAKNLEIYNHRHFNGALKGYLVRTFEEFTAAFETAQQQSDMIILGGNGGIQNWNDQAAKAFLEARTRVPTCSFDDYLVDFAMFSFAKDPAEQGEWMASTALRILDGALPGDIPMVENKRVRLFVNLRIAKAAGLTLPVSLLKTATVIGRDE